MRTDRAFYTCEYPEIDGVKPTIKDVERFWRQIPIGEDDECWKWDKDYVRTVAGFRYGRFPFWRDGKNVRRLAHRVSYTCAFGPIPEGMIIRHKCNEPACVNPHHLVAGTMKDNAFDRDSAGRRNAAAGEDHGCVKLTEQQVREIREIGDSMEQREIAKTFGVSQTTIWSIIRRRTWKSLI